MKMLETWRGHQLCSSEALNGVEKVARDGKGCIFSFWKRRSQFPQAWSQGCARTCIVSSCATASSLLRDVPTSWGTADGVGMENCWVESNPWLLQAPPSTTLQPHLQGGRIQAEPDVAQWWVSKQGSSQALASEDGGGKGCLVGSMFSCLSCPRGDVLQNYPVTNSLLDLSATLGLIPGNYYLKTGISNNYL